MVPEGWHMEILKNIVDGNIKNGYSPNAAEKNTGHWVLGLGALGDNSLIASEIKPVEATQKVLNCRLHPGDFLISRSNTPDKVGRSILFKGEIDNCSYPDLMMRFRVNEDIVDTGFIEEKLKSSFVRGYFKNCAAGSSRTMVKINKPIVEKTLLLLPPLHEQKKIARILSTWNKAIETVEKMVENSKAQKKALMQQLLTRKRQLPEFEGTWLRVKLSDLTEITYGKSPKEILCNEGKFPVIGTGGIIGQTNTALYSGPSVIIGRKGTINNPLYITGSFWAIDTTFYCIPKSTCDINWLYHTFTSINLKRYNEASSVPSLSRETLYSIQLLTPPIKEQQKIASVLATADRKIESLQQKLHYLTQEKKALMQQLLTGKRRVKVDIDG